MASTTAPIYRSTVVSLLSGILVCGLLAGCAASPQVGVRPEYQRDRLDEVAVAPFYAKSQFGLSEEELDELLAASEAGAVEALGTLGVEVIPPEEFRAYLDAQEAASRFDDGVPLRSSLSNYFEPAEANEPSDALEVTTVSTLHNEQKLPTDALLFGELVYHTRTECRADPTQFNKHAKVVRSTDSRRRPEPGLCLVSHVRAKLVDATNGRTMWFNTLLLQTHLQPGEELEDVDHAADAIARTIGGEDGLSDFVGDADTVRVEAQ
ncbi:MAG: hypothetical protein ACOCV2_15595 [Persicimonas sp.]